MQRKVDFMKQDILEMRTWMKVHKNECLEIKAMSPEDFKQQLRQVLADELEKEEWGYNVGLYTNKTEEAEKFKVVISEINRIIGNIESYMRDLWTDIYIGLLRADEDRDVEPSDLMKIGWESGPCNSTNVDIKNAKLHYPLADYGDDNFPFSCIPGGCKEYHELMMQQKNIGFFDADSKKESLKQYAFPKTYEIYQALAYSPIENLLLLEKTQGIGYTNQLFYYLEDITGKKQLEQLEEFIILGAGIPMFIRKDITSKIWLYLRKFNYNDASIKCVSNEIHGITYMIKRAYKKIWKYSWQKVSKFEAPINSLEGTLHWWWRDYFSWGEIYEDFIKSKGLLDIRGIEKAKDCFIERGEELYPINPIGDELVKKFFRMCEKMSQEESYQKSREKMLEEAFEELKKNQQEIWDNVDPRRKTKQLKPMDVYAMIHVDVVKALNEYKAEC